MKPDRKIEPEKIHMVSIRTIKGNIDAERDVTEDLIGGHSFSFEAQSGMDESQNIIGLMLYIAIEAVDKSNSPLGIKGSYTHEIVFQTENMQDFIEHKQTEKGKTESIIDATLVSTLVGIGFSTVRGIIFSRTQGTSLGTVILPVIDPKKLLQVPAAEIK